MRRRMLVGFFYGITGLGAFGRGLFGFHAS